MISQPNARAEIISVPRYRAREEFDVVTKAEIHG